jgi:hypothetical protein
MLDSLTIHQSADIAEAFVVYHLSSHGLPTVMAPSQFAPYDLIADNCGKLITIQVKGTPAIRANGPNHYVWNTGRRRGNAPPYQKEGYKPGDFDWIALVIVKEQRVVYLPGSYIFNRPASRQVTMTPQRFALLEEASLAAILGFATLLEDTIDLRVNSTNLCL